MTIIFRSMMRKRQGESPRMICHEVKEVEGEREGGENNHLSLVLLARVCVYVRKEEEHETC